MNEIDLDKVLLPREAATFLGVSMGKLSRLRRDGRIKGTQIEEMNLYGYTIADLRKADMQNRKRGRKPKESSATNATGSHL